MPSIIRPPSFSGYDNRVSSTGPGTAAAAPQGRLAGLSALFAVTTFVVLAGITERATAQAKVDFRRAKVPVIVSLPLPSPQSLLQSTSAQRVELVRERAALLVEAIEENPCRLVTLDLGRGRLMFATLSAQQQANLLLLMGDEAPVLYELAMASLIDEILEAATSARPGSPVSVLGLPFEPRHTLPGSIRDSNDRYQRVIDDLAAFVSYRTFVLFGSKEPEHQTIQRGLPEAFGLRQGRPLIFRTNAHWSILFGDTADFNEFGSENEWIADQVKPHGRASGSITRIAHGRKATAQRNQRIIPRNQRGRLKPARTKSPTAADQGTRPEIVAGD